MRYRRLYTITALTMFVFFTHTAAVHAQHRRIEYNMANVQTGELSGKVTYSGDPMAGVRVVLSYKGDGIAEATTGTDGSYHFKELNGDHYTLSFFKTGYRKRIVDEVPVVETYISSSEVALHKVENWHEERNPQELTFEELKHHSIEKIK